MTREVAWPELAAGFLLVVLLAKALEAAGAAGSP